MSIWFEPFWFALIGWQRHHPSENQDSTSWVNSDPSPSLPLFTFHQFPMFVLSLAHPILSSCPSSYPFILSLFFLPTSSHLSCCKNFLSGLPASIIFLLNPLACSAQSYLQSLILINVFGRFVVHSHSPWTLQEFTIQRGRQAKLKNKYNPIWNCKSGGSNTAQCWISSSPLTELSSLVVPSSMYLTALFLMPLASHLSHPFTVHSPLVSLLD